MPRTDKFYLFDTGIANHLARRRSEIGSAEFGKSFEHCHRIGDADHVESTDWS